ncbi:MAG: NADPH:quinone oxidoreductase family protein [Deltaproteobacteria bacterium]|nr:NADPH:quinone oxidoreductase family protein [Deltaproteobacteria bacterium]
MTDGEALRAGRKAQITELGEVPMDAIEHHLEVVDQAIPDPERGDDVVVAIRSAALNWVDLMMTSGQYQHLPKPPYTPGLEYAGVVVKVGPEVRELATGDRVMLDGLLAGPRSLGDHQRWGGFASYAVAPERALIPIPGPLDFDQAASLLGAYETAYHVLLHRGRIQKGETVLIHGASGATGLAAVDLAKRAGCRVIATGRTESKLAVVAERGADHTLAIGNDEGGVRRFRDDVKALTDGKGADVVYDGVGGEVAYETLRCVRFGARYLIVGWASTPFVARGKGQRGAPNANVFPTNLVLMKGLDVLGCPAAIAAHKDPSLRKTRLGEILAWAEAGEITPHVGASFELEDIAEAMKAKWKSRMVGGCVVRPPALDSHG